MNVDGMDFGGASFLLVSADVSVESVLSVAVPKERRGISIYLSKEKPVRADKRKRSGRNLRNGLMLEIAGEY